MNTTGEVVTVRGWAHLSCGPWRIDLKIPRGWKRIRRGVTLPGDKCMVAKNLDRVRKFPRPKDAIVPGKWETVKTQNVLIDVGKFKAVIREEGVDR